MKTPSPDQRATGFLSVCPDPLRYDGHTTNPAEVAGLIIALIPPRARVLDVGCGTGSLSKLLVDGCGAQLIGIEPDPQRAAAAQARGIKVQEAFFDEKTVGQLGKFDVVLFADVLEHLPDPAAALRLAHRVLEAGGIVVASVPNIAHWSVRWDLLRGRFDYQPCGIMDATHLRWFTESSIRALFEATGYRVDRIRPSAGVGLPVYFERFPWRYFRPRGYRNSLIRLLAKAMPRLFGCQHVICASRKP
jgi:methionine biosynthesis protein MetW